MRPGEPASSPASAGRFPVNGVARPRGSRARRSALGGVCVALKAPSRRAGPAPSLTAPRREEPRSRAAVEGASARPGGQSGGGRRGGPGRAGGGRGAGGAALGKRAQARGARRGRAGRGGRGRPSPTRRPVAPPAQTGARGLARLRAEGQRAGGGGAERRLRAPCAPARRARRALPPLVSPRLASSSCSSRLLSSTRRRSRPRPAARPSPARPPAPLSLGPARRGPGPRGQHRPSPRGPAIPDLSDRGLSRGSVVAPEDPGARLSGPSRPLRTPQVPERGHSGSGLSAPRAPTGASSLRAGQGRPRQSPEPADLDWTERIQDGAEPRECRAWAEGIPAPSDPSDFGLRAGTGPASPRSPCARFTCGLRAPDPPDPCSFPTRARRGLGEIFPGLFLGAWRPRPLPPSRCLQWRL